MRWLLAFHIIFVVCWFAGLFYLPRLFVYHTQTDDNISLERFKLMEKRLYYGIMTPAAILTLIFGSWLLVLNWSIYIKMGWLHLKLFLVFLLIIYHLYCGHLLNLFKQNKNKFSTRFYRWFNEIPTVLLFLIIILVVVQPF